MVLYQRLHISQGLGFMAGDVNTPGQAELAWAGSWLLLKNARLSPGSSLRF